MHEVDHDRDLDLARLRFGLDPGDLVVVAIDERDPGALVSGVAALALVEDLADDRGGGLDDAGGQPLVLGDRPMRRGGALLVVGGQHVGGGARGRGGVIDGADLGHPLAVALLALRQPRLQVAGNAEIWVREHATAILEGRATQVAGQLRRAATNAGLDPAKRAGADACATYLTNQHAHMDYPTALANGWPIATGVIEGACRHLVKDRTGAECGHRRALTSVFGELSVRRLAYRRRGCENLHPADAALNLPRERYSHGLRRLAAIESSRGSFDDTVQAIDRATGQQVGKRQAEQLAARAAADFDAQCRQAGAQDGGLVVLSCPATARAS